MGEGVEEGARVFAERSTLRFRRAGSSPSHSRME